MTYRILLLALLGACLLGTEAAHAQYATVRGFVTDASNGESLEFVNVALRRTDGRLKGAVTNRDGLYVVADVFPGTYVLRASYLGFATYVDTLDIAGGESLNYNIEMRTSAEELDELLVESERSTGAARVTAGQQTVRAADIELLPAPDVSGDLANLLTSLPGVVTSGDRGGQLFIRGGEPTQNLVLLDGILLYQPFHVLGFYSAFPSDIINRTDIFAGGFGSRYGERISAVIDVSTRNGNNKRFTGALSASPFVSSVRVEGPLVKDRVSVLFSARESVLEHGAQRIVDQRLPFTFGDAFGKMHLQVTDNQRLSFTGLTTHDRGTLAEPLGGLPPEEVRWENQGLGMRYLVLPRLYPVLFEATVSYSRLDSELGPDGDPTRSSAIQNVHGQMDVTFYQNRGAWNLGMGIRHIRLDTDLGGLFQNLETRETEMLHWDVHIEPEFELSKTLKARIGTRVQFYDVQFAPYLEPRARIVWESGRHQASFATGLYQQTELGLNDRRDAASIFTAWTNTVRESELVDDVSEGRVQRALHFLFGYRTTPMAGVELSAEAFYKRLSNLFVGEWTAYPRFTTDLQPATGRSLGFDLRGEYQRGPFYSYLTYGFSNTKYAAEQAELELWYGTETLEYRPPHDRRHQLNALAATTWRGIELSARWEYGSGLPFSQVVGFDGFAVVDDVVDAFDLPTDRRVIYERPFGGELPAYHRLDISASHTFTSEHVDLTVQGTLINAYDRNNLFYLDVFTLRRVNQLPRVPSLGLKVEFK